MGLTLTMIHLATIPVDNTSVNPARSFGAAIFSGTDALSQLWAFIIFPLLGAVLGVVLWLLLHDARLEDTMLSNPRLGRMRDSGQAAAEPRCEPSSLTHGALSPTTVWPADPFIFEINTWPWLRRVGVGPGPATWRPCPAGMGRIAPAGFDAVWLMGVWERSPAASPVALD